MSEGRRQHGGVDSHPPRGPQVDPEHGPRWVHRFQKRLAREEVGIEFLPFPSQFLHESLAIGEEVVHPQRPLVEELRQVRGAEPRVKLQVPLDQPLEGLPLSS
ncbi:MAG: hypothetical protein Kow0097_14260 [Candidatus Bipolaricaulota bacterium]|nr:hypothetical protein [Candidatus Bipolaricaulota bacterium]